MSDFISKLQSALTEAGVNPIFTAGSNTDQQSTLDRFGLRPRTATAQSTSSNWLKLWTQIDNLVVQALQNNQIDRNDAQAYVRAKQVIINTIKKAGNNQGHP